MTWQPANTAPHDGRTLWCRLDFRDVLSPEQHAMYWDKRSEDDGYPWAFRWDGKNASARVREDIVTHWRDLPEDDT